MILALDLGTRTGWAYWNGVRRESGVQVFDVKRGESPGMRYMRFNAWLGCWVLKDYPRPALIVYEQTHQRGGAATEVAAGFSTRVQEFCSAHGIEHAAVHTATLKKWVTAHGNADKTLMLHTVNQRFGTQLTDDNEADAVGLLEYAKAELVPKAVAR